jgi:hypothetical protein
VQRRSNSQVCGSGLHRHLSNAGCCLGFCAVVVLAVLAVQTLLLLLGLPGNAAMLQGNNMQNSGSVNG